MALLLPRPAAYVMAYAYDFLQFSGPVQSLLRQAMGGARDYWFPDLRTLGVGDAHVHVRAVSVRVPAARTLLRADRQHVEVAGASVTGRGQFHAVDIAARPAGIWPVRARADGGARRFGTVANFALPTFTTGNLQRLFALGDHALQHNCPPPAGHRFVLLIVERWSRKGAVFHGSAQRKAAQRLSPPRCGGGGVDVRLRLPWSWDSASAGELLHLPTRPLDANSARVTSISREHATWRASRVCLPSGWRCRWPTARSSLGAAARAASRLAALGKQCPAQSSQSAC